MFFYSHGYFLYINSPNYIFFPFLSIFFFFFFFFFFFYLITLTLLYAKKKRNRKVVILECTEARKLGKQPSRYVTEKNKNNTPKKLQLYKYNKYLKRRTLHVEIK
ncbi:ribosomal protein L33 [Plasmodium falciparum Vietnam Oak-Knoll (FVO)]|uniref:Ribosomal protein L33 n=1 Tax=Plasmodium falciparum Vietnam Oak-Knoll (FVO) TaxID=1036723 RepID=A0A024V9Y1_PLAFA|nr:ribosomal protein L33 [Plasmodium falciparum Vietnam Oak-Knoll (FVO)]